MSLIAALLLGMVPGQPPQNPEPPPGKLALLIGISEYPQVEGYEGFPPLTGCLNDVELVRQILVERFGFGEKNSAIQILLNENATHRNVVASIHRLIQQAGDQTEVLIYFAGHGSRLPDASGQAAVELDGMDSTFVLYDSRLPKFGSPFDMSDDELFSLVQALCAKTQHVTLITDCCHSGGIVRGNRGATARRAPAGEAAFDPKNLTPFWPKEIPLLDDGDLRRQPDLPYVHLAACAADEVALEMPNDEIKGSYGLMTYHLVDALRNIEPDTTFEKLAAYLQVKVSSEVWGQQIQLEGRGDRVVFSGEFAAPLPGFPGICEAGHDRIEIEAGRLHLLTEETEFEIQDLNGKILGLASAWEVDAYSCIAEWQNSSFEIDQSIPIRAIPREAWSSIAMRVFVEDGARGDRISASLNTELGSTFELVRDPDAIAECQIRQAGECGEGPWQLCSTADGQVLWTSTALDSDSDGDSDGDGDGDGDPESIKPSFKPGDFAAIAAALKRERLYQSLMELGGSRGGIGVELTMKPASDEMLERLRNVDPKRKFAAATSMDPPSGLTNQTSSFTELLDRQAENLADVAELHAIIDPETWPIGGYLAILCLSSDRTITTIYPQDRAKGNSLEPGTTFSLPIEVYFNDGADPKLGVHDRYFAIVTASWVDFSAFSRSLPVQKAAERASKSHRGAPGITSEMPNILTQALQGKTNRGPSPARSDDWSFGVSFLDIHVILPVHR